MGPWASAWPGSRSERAHRLRPRAAGTRPGTARPGGARGRAHRRRGYPAVPWGVLGWLFLLFLVVPIAELAVILQVGQLIGPWYTILLLLAVSVVGAWLVKREGLGVVRRFRRQLDAGTLPGKELADGVMILFAGALLLTPGFITDTLGLSLLLPPVRAAIRAALLRRLAVRVRYRRRY